MRHWKYYNIFDVIRPILMRPQFIVHLKSMNVDKPLAPNTLLSPAILVTTNFALTDDLTSLRISRSPVVFVLS